MGCLKVDRYACNAAWFEVWGFDFPWIWYPRLEEELGRIENSFSYEAINDVTATRALIESIAVLGRLKADNVAQGFTIWAANPLSPQRSPYTFQMLLLGAKYAIIQDLQAPSDVAVGERPPGY